MDSFYPCVKYKKPADPIFDGTNYFIVAESMYLNNDLKYLLNPEADACYGHLDRLFWINCFLSFTCENDKKAFYKLIKDCLHNGKFNDLGFFADPYQSGTIRCQ